MVNINSNYIHEILKICKGSNIKFKIRNHLLTISSEEYDKEGNLKISVLRTFKRHYFEDDTTIVIDRLVLNSIPKNVLIEIHKDSLKFENRNINFKSKETTVYSIKNTMDHVVTVSKEEVKLIKNMSYAANKDNFKNLNSIYLNDYDFVCLDGYRLALRRIKNKSNRSVLIPSYIFKLLNYECEIEIKCNERYVSFILEDLIITTEITEGTYTDYKNIIPSNIETEFKVVAEDILGTLKDFKKSKIEVVTLNVIKDKLIICGKNEKLKISDELFIKKYGDDVHINSNVNYLIEALKNYDKPMIKINSYVEPFLITENNKLDLILPVRCDFNI